MMRLSILRKFSTISSVPALPFKMRSFLFPKNTKSCLVKVSGLQHDPDVVALDLEDSVHTSEKRGLRDMYLEALKDGILARFKVFLRTSSLHDTKNIQEDIGTFVGSGIDGFILPKVESANSVIEIDNLITRFEKEKNVTSPIHKLIPLVESPAAYFCVDKIATASDRNVAILAGSADFTSDAVCDDHSFAYDAFFSKAVLAARAAKIGAIWGVNDKIDDHIGMEKSCIKMKQAGYNGMVTLTLKQVIQANNIFSLTPKESKWVDQVLNKPNKEKSLAMLHPSIQESRQMIGPPHRKKAENMKKLYQPLEWPNKDMTKPAIKGVKPVRGMPTNASIGEIVCLPNKIVVDESLITLWCSSFTHGNAYNKLDEVLGGTRQKLPFPLLATMGVALTVPFLTYHARVHLGFRNIFQYRPLFAGNAVHAMYRIDDLKSVKSRSNGHVEYSIITSTHWLANQANEIILQLEKVTMFSPDDCKVVLRKDKPHTNTLKPNDSLLLKSIAQCTSQEIFPLHSQPSLHTGELFFHDLVKVMGHSETRMLCNLLGIVNPHHHNKVRYSHQDLLVPGPFVMSAGIANTLMDLGEVLYENILHCINPNKVNFGDQISTMTYITQCKQFRENSNFEEVNLKHLIVKNIDMEILSQYEIPLDLFEVDKMKPSEIEAFCAKNYPILLHKIVCVVSRKIIRVRPGLCSLSETPKELYF